VSLLETQQILARLYTDPVTLNAFLEDPEGFAAGHSKESELVLSEIDQWQLEFFASSLRSKRLGEVRKLLPLTTRALGQRCIEEFRNYSATSLPGGARKHLADAMAFCEYLLSKTEDSTLAEAASYELSSFKVRFDIGYDGESPTVVRAFRSRRPWLYLRRFSANVPEPGYSRTSETTGRRLVLFLRIPGIQGVWYW
jgi:hypothetical protein